MAPVRSTADPSRPREQAGTHNGAGRTASGVLASLASLVPGAIQGSSQVLLGHPLDTIKTRIQTAPPDAPKQKVIAVMRKIVREEGFIALYRGVSPPLILTASKRSLQFALWERLNELLGSKGFVSGAIAGILGTVVGCPMHVIKIQTQNSKRRDVKNAWSCFLHIIHTEGPRGLYRGMYAQILKDTAFASVYLGLYGYGRQWAVKDTDHRRNGDSKGTSLGAPHGSSVALVLEYQTFKLFLVGSLASMMTWALLQPLDTFKTFVQSKRSPREFVSTIQRPNGGWRLMWRGLPAALLRAGPVSGCAMLSYEFARHMMSRLSN